MRADGAHGGCQCAPTVQINELGTKAAFGRFLPLAKGSNRPEADVHEQLLPAKSWRFVACKLGWRSMTFASARAYVCKQNVK